MVEPMKLARWIEGGSPRSHVMFWRDNPSPGKVGNLWDLEYIAGGTRAVLGYPVAGYVIV